MNITKIVEAILATMVCVGGLVVYSAITYVIVIAVQDYVDKWRFYE